MVPTTIAEARQLVSTKIMPTERSSPRVSTGMVCAMATSASSTPLLAAVVATAGVEARLVIADVDGEHHGEEADRHQRAEIVRDMVAPVVHAAFSGTGFDIEGAGDDVVLGDSSPFSSRVMRPS